MKIDLHDEGRVVVSLEVARHKWEKRADKKPCDHLKIYVDPALATIECQDCKEKLAPVAWIMTLADNWQYVQHQTAAWNDAYKRAQTAERLLNMKARCRCEHCNRVTRIPQPQPHVIARLIRSSNDDKVTP